MYYTRVITKYYFTSFGGVVLQKPESTSSKIHVSFQCRGFRVVSFVLSGKISNTAKEIVHLVRIKVHIDPEAEGSQMVENGILLPFFHSVIVRRMYCECGLP